MKALLVALLLAVATASAPLAIATPAAAQEKCETCN